MEYPSGLAVTEHMPSSSGPRDPVVVLVHGSLDRSASFARVLRRLGDLPVVVYDRRGYQGSRRALPLRTTLDGQIDDLIDVIGGRSAVVVGHSYGGTLSLGAALRRHPSSPITSVAAYEPPLPWLASWTSNGTTGESNAPSTRNRAVIGSPDEEAERFFRRMVGGKVWERLPESERDERRADGPALVAELQAMRVRYPPFDVAAMEIPALFGRGGQSLHRHRAGVAWLVEHTPGSELFEIPGAAHGAHLSHPDGFAALIRRAVERAREAGGHGVDTGEIAMTTEWQQDG